jgi:uncharacterized protein with HEPN domain
MFEKDWLIRLDDILKCCQKIKAYSKDYKNLESLSENAMAYDAIERNIEIIAEACKKIPETIRQEFSEIPWSQIIGTRNFIAHNYDEINHDIVWNIIRNEIDTLEISILKIKNQYGE